MTLSLIPICDETDHVMECTIYKMRDQHYTSYCGVCDKSCLAYTCRNCTYTLCYECHTEKLDTINMCDEEVKVSMKKAISDNIDSSNLKLTTDGLGEWSCGIRAGELYYYNKRTGTRSYDYPQQDTPPPSPLTLEPMSPVRAKSRRMYKGLSMNQPVPIGRPGRYGREKIDKTDRHGNVEPAESAESAEPDLSVEGFAMKLFNQMRDSASRLNLY